MCETFYNQVYDKAQASKVGMVLVNSNHAKRDKGDSFDDMVARTKAKGFKMDYVLDEESALANAFGAKTTPHVFLLDKNMKLVYRGSIDDNVKSATAVKEKYLDIALTNLAKGEKIKNSDTKPVGCSIKRLAKQFLVETINEVFILGTIGLILSITGLLFLLYINIPYEEIGKPGVNEKLRKKLIQQKISYILISMGLILMLVEHIYTVKWVEKTLDVIRMLIHGQHTH